MLTRDDILTVDAIKMHTRYNPETGALTRTKTGKPVYLEDTPGGPRMELLGYKIHARRVVMVHILGRFPGPHEYKHVAEDNRDFRADTFILRNPGDSKLCTGCKQVLPISQFDKNRAQGSRYSCRCKACVSDFKRGYNRRIRGRKYGLSPEQVREMVDAQDNKCKLCGAPAEDEPTGVLAIDHCHATDKVRGLLCMKCNMGLGAFRDDPRLLLAAAKYVLEHK